jgi:guanylate kinase
MSSKAKAKTPAHDPLAIHRRGVMLVLSSPSGAGKTTISRALLEREPNLTMSISATTRAKRPGETAGVDYFFVDPTEFNLMVNRQELLEHARVFENYYVTPKAPVETALAAGKDVLFDIDWQGTQQLYQKMDRDVVRVFLLPPSLDELRRRLTARGTDSVSDSIGEVTRIAGESGQAAGLVLAGADTLSAEARALRDAVDGFLGRVRTA